MSRLTRAGGLPDEKVQAGRPGGWSGTQALIGRAADVTERGSGQIINIASIGALSVVPTAAV